MPHLVYSLSRHLACAAFFCILAVSSQTALAQQQDERLSIKVGEADLYPSVRLDYTSNDNAYLNSADATDTTLFRVRPEVELVAAQRTTELRLIYQGDYASSSESTLNYADHRLLLLGDIDLATRHRVSGSLRFDAEHEELGTQRTLGIAAPETDLIELFEYFGRAEYTFGARAARGNIEAGFEFGSVAFQNQPFLTQGSDYNWLGPYAQFSYRLSPDTRLRLGVSYDVLDYTDNNAANRQDLEVYASATISEQRKLSGRVQLGVVQTAYDLEGRDNSTELSADIYLIYRPLSFSRLELQIGRDLDDSDASRLGRDVAQTVENVVVLRWNHQWSPRVLTRSFISSTETDRECPLIGNRTTTVGLDFGISVRQNMTLGFNMQGRSRSTDNCTGDVLVDDLDYDRRLLGLFFELST